MKKRFSFSSEFKKKLSLKKNFFPLVGIFLIFLGIGIISWQTWFGLERTSWKVQVEGATHISPQEIEDLVLYLLRQPGGISKEQIHKALLLNPRITSTEIKIENKKIKIRITEKASALLVHSPPLLLEFSQDLEVLQENLLPMNYQFDATLPLFYLNALQMSNEKHKKEFTKYQRDIIRLWESTESSYSFIWQRISEIETIWKKEKAHFYLYTTKQKAKIHLQEPLSLETLRCLWATFYYLEKVVPSEFFREIELHPDHAIVKTTGRI